MREPDHRPGPRRPRARNSTRRPEVIVRPRRNNEGASIGESPSRPIRDRTNDIVK